MCELAGVFAAHLADLGQDGAHRVVGGDLLELAVAEQVAAAVADVDDERPRPDDVDHRHRRAHALHFGVLGDDGLDAFLAGLERFFEMVFEILLGVFFEAEAPGEAVEDVGRDLVDGDGAGPLAFGLAAHAVGDDQQLALRAAVDAGLIVEVEARAVDAHRLVQVGDEKMVLVGGPLAADVGYSVAVHMREHREPHVWEERKRRE